MAERYHPSRKMGVTQRQMAVLNYIKSYCEKNGFSPSYQEIGDSVGIGSKSGVKRMVDILIERGHLASLPYRARSLVVIVDSQ